MGDNGYLRVSCRALKATLGLKVKKAIKATPEKPGLRARLGLKGRRVIPGHRVKPGLKALLVLLLALGKSLLL